MTTLRKQAVEESNKRTELSADIQEKINPSHYTQGNIQTIDYILDQQMDYMTATITKYISRWRFKDGVCDLKKAQWFLNKLIEIEEKKV